MSTFNKTAQQHIYKKMECVEKIDILSNAELPIHYLKLISEHLLRKENAIIMVSIFL